MASLTQAIVFAVYCAPQAPDDGQATRSMISSSASDIDPACTLPTASNMSCTVMSWPL